MIAYRSGASSHIPQQHLSCAPLPGHQLRVFFAGPVCLTVSAWLPGLVSPDACPSYFGVRATLLTEA